MLRREGDGCPVTGALRLVGDKWTMLIVRDLARAPRRTTELLASLHPISSRTLVERLRDMERDLLVERKNLSASPPRVEYSLTHRGRKLLPLLESLRALGETLDCNVCEDRLERAGAYCEACPRNEREAATDEERETDARPAHKPRADDSIVLL